MENSNVIFSINIGGVQVEFSNPSELSNEHLRKVEERFTHFQESCIEKSVQNFLKNEDPTLLRKVNIQVDSEGSSL